MKGVFCESFAEERIGVGVLDQGLQMVLDERSGGMGRRGSGVWCSFTVFKPLIIEDLEMF